jgi:hypothetical protein
VLILHAACRWRHVLLCTHPPPRSTTLTLSCSAAAVCAQCFLTRALMPLHKPKCVAMYHQQLSYCVTQVRRSKGRVQQQQHRADLWDM